MQATKSKKWSKVLTILFFVIFYAPLASLIIFSFNNRRSVTSWSGFTFKWYKNLFTNQQIIEIVLTTIIIAVISTFCAIIIGTLASIGLTKVKNKSRNTILQINNLPITNPDIVTAIGLLLLFVSLGVERGYGTMLLAHISFCTPYVIVTVYPKIKSLDPNLIEAAMDLGAKPTKAIRSAILPQIKPSIFAAAAISFTMSFDDFVISYFTGGKSLNISTYLYTNAKKFNPTFNALSTIIILVIVLKIVFDKIRKRKEKDDDILDSKPGYISLPKKLLLGLCGILLIISPFWLTKIGKNTIYIFNCGQYIDDDGIDGVDLVSKFEAEYNCRVVYNTFESNEAAISKLETETYDIVVPSEYAIEQLYLEDKLLEIDWSKIEGFSKDDITLSLLNILDDLKNQENGYDLLNYGVPYFFGSVGVVYNKAKVSQEDLENEGWGILKNSKYKVACYDSSRDAYMVALKDLGYSMNTSDKAEIDKATQWLSEMKKNTNCSFKTDELLDEMPNKNCNFDLTFMYSGEATYVIDVAAENGIELGYYVPKSGTNIFCDAMVIPKDAKNVDLAYKFISFMSNPENALANSEYVCYTSAVNSAYDSAIAEDGAFADLKDIYEVIYSKETDEIFRYNKETKAILNENWSNIKM